MVTVGTTPKAIYGPVRRPITISVHALAANTATVQVSTTDSTAQADFEELLAGQSLIIDGFVGSLFGYAGSTQTVLIVEFSDTVGSVEKF